MPDQHVGDNGHEGRPSKERHGQRGPGRPFKARRPGNRGPRSSGGSARPGPIGLRRVGGEDFELVHPRCVEETELDYEEGIELWKAGDPESARDALAVCTVGLSRQHLDPCGPRADRARSNFAILRWRAGTSATRSSWPTGRCPADFRGGCRAIGPTIGRFTKPSTAWPTASTHWAVMATARAYERSVFGSRAARVESRAGTL